MKKIIFGVAYTLWGTIVLLLSSIPYVSADFKHFDVLMAMSVIIALAVHLRLRDFKGTFPIRYIWIYTLLLVVLANILGLICLGLVYSGGIAQ